MAERRRRREVSVSRDLHPWALGAPLRHRRRRRPCRDLAGSPGSGSCRRVSTPPRPKPCTDCAVMSSRAGAIDVGN